MASHDRAENARRACAVFIFLVGAYAFGFGIGFMEDSWAGMALCIGGGTFLAFGVVWIASLVAKAELRAHRVEGERR